MAKNGNRFRIEVCVLRALWDNRGAVRPCGTLLVRGAVFSVFRAEGRLCFLTYDDMNDFLLGMMRRGLISGDNEESSIFWTLTSDGERKIKRTLVMEEIEGGV